MEKQPTALEIFKLERRIAKLENNHTENIRDWKFK